MLPCAMQSLAPTVDAYLAELPPDRRAAVQAVRRVFLGNLDEGFEEGMQYGMIGYYVPHRLYPKGYHCDPKQPLPFAALGSQKNYLSIHLMCVYGDGAAAERFRTAWAAAGKKLDMGKACIRFKRPEDLALDVLGDTIRGITVERWIKCCERPKGGQATGERATRERATARQAKGRRPRPGE